jgi:hypothetical protein
MTSMAVLFQSVTRSARDCVAPEIGHFEGTRDSGRFVLDVLRGAKPPFDPQTVTKNYAELLREYGLHEVVGDNYAASWVETAFKDGLQVCSRRQAEEPTVSRSPDAVC